MRRLFTISAIVLLPGMMALSAWSATNTRVDIADGKQPDKINGFDISTYRTAERSLMRDDGPDVGGAAMFEFVCRPRDGIVKEIQSGRREEDAIREE